MVGEALATLQVGLAAVFGFAAVAKMIDHRSIRDALTASSMPTPLVGVTSVLVPIIELTLAIALTVTPARGPLQGELAIAIAVLAAFTVWMGWVLHRGISTACACFGGWGGMVGRAGLIRNGTLIGLCGVALYLSTITDSALPAFSVWFGSIIVAAVTAAGLFISMLRGLRWLKLTSQAWQDDSELRATR